jgi:hypothetical protein
MLEMCVIMLLRRKTVSLNGKRVAPMLSVKKEKDRQTDTRD